MGGWNAAWSELTAVLQAVWEVINLLVTSHLFESGLVALAGAFFGAKTAQGTAARNKFRDDITKEIRDTNAAIALAFAICNSSIAIKRQHLRSLKETFERDKKELIEYERKRRTGEIQGNKVYELKVDFRYLPVPALPTDKLQAHVLDRLSVISRALNLAVHIAESAVALRDSTASRNEQIKAFRALPRDRAFMDRYFGLPGSGEIDEIYATTIDAMVLHADCSIYFTYLFCGDLHTHGEVLLEKYKKRLGRKGAPPITEVDFSMAIADNLIPPEAEFKSWSTAFITRPQRRSQLAQAWYALLGQRAKSA